MLVRDGRERRNGGLVTARLPSSLGKMAIDASQRPPGRIVQSSVALSGALSHCSSFGCPGRGFQYHRTTASACPPETGGGVGTHLRADEVANRLSRTTGSSRPSWRCRIQAEPLVEH